MKNNIVYVDIQEIAKYIEKVVESGKTPDDFGNMMVSPFEDVAFKTWIPFHPNYIFSRAITIDLDEQRKQFKGMVSNVDGKQIDDNVRWLLYFSLYIQDIQEKNRLVTSVMRIYRDTNDISKEYKIEINPGPRFNNTEENLDLLRKILLHCFTHYRHAVALLHCKNVELVDEPLTRQQRRLKERKARTIYKVLAIKEGDKSYRYLEHGHDGSKKALHLCRGHFRTYTDDAPLFGRVIGTFWIPAHVKGNKQFGEVVKDYKVIPATD